MSNKYLLKDEGGFTLIEIIAVLVIMGILAAVAVPKFFDLQSRARDKAVYTAMSELKVRVNQYFAEELLDGYTWGDATRMNWSAASVGTNVGDDFWVETWTPSTDGVGGKPSKTTGSIAVKIWYQKLDTPLAYTETIDLPRYDN